MKESLPDYVRRVRAESGLSLLDVERQSARSGFKIAGSYVSRIENKRALNPSKDKLIALAKGLRIPEEELFAVARGKALSDPDVQEEYLLRMFRELPTEQRDHVLDLVRTVHKRYAVKRKPRAA